MNVLTSHLVSSSSFDVGQCPQVIAAGTLSASFYSAPLQILNTTMWSATAVVTGAYGKAGWQVSNDPGSPIGTGRSPAIQYWMDYPGIEQTLSSTDLEQDYSIWNMQAQGFRWLRFKWTHLKGSGSIDINVTAKGIST